MGKLLLLCVLGAAMFGAACDDILGTSSSDSIAVQLNEWAITADPGSTVAGANTFEVTNNGREPHNFVVLLPSEDYDGKYVIVGELGELQPEDTGTLTVTLEEGLTYQLASLRVSITAGDMLSDYDQGMQLDYPVE
jgi:hypothetical protein